VGVRRRRDDDRSRAGIESALDGRGGFRPRPCLVRRVSPIGMARIVLVATCVTAAQPIERMPNDEYVTLEGLALPHLTLNAREASAPAKLLHAIEHLGAGPQQAYQPRPLGGPGRAGTGDTP